MTCHEALGQIAEQDAGQDMSRELAAHLAACAACRTVVAQLHALSSAALRESDARHAFTDRVMAAVRAEAALQSTAADEEPPLRLPGFTAGGVVILASLVLLQFSNVVDWLRQSMGAVIDVALGVMLGLALTIYICVLVGSNLRAVGRILRLRH